MKFIMNIWKEINVQLGINETIDEDEYKVARVVLEKLNSYFYQEKDEYISEYHEYWKTNHEKQARQ